MGTERKPSIWEDVWAEMQGLRVVRLEKLGQRSLEETRRPDEVNAMLRGAMHGVLQLVGEKWNAGAEAYLLLAWEEYLRDEWARQLTPPFPLVGFCSPAVLERCWRAAEAEL